MNNVSFFKLMAIVCSLSLLIYVIFITLDERDELQRERESLIKERQSLQQERDSLHQERAGHQSDRKDIKQERDNIQQQLDNIQLQQINLQKDRENIDKERDGLQSEIADLQKERKSLQLERESIQAERAALMIPLRDSTKPQVNREVQIQITDQLKPFMDRNREVLANVTRWIDDDVYIKSFFMYGIPLSVYNLVNKPIGFEPTYSDVLSYLGNVYFPGPKSYLEIGVSVGKNVYQMLNAFEDSYLYAYELENINPILEKLVDNKTVISTWSTMKGSARKVDSYLNSYFFPPTRTTLYYLASDVYDANSWIQLANESHKYDIIFSDGLHSPKALLQEIDKLLEWDLINEDRFMIWYDDLGGSMTKTFMEIVEKLKTKFPSLGDDNVAIVKVGGWFGVNENKHLNGIITSLNITKILKDDLTSLNKETNKRVIVPYEI